MSESQVSIWTSFIAGVISFLSPCVLPLVPGYISFMSGLSLEELSKGGDIPGVRKKAVMGALSFVIGFAVVFTSLGASASAVGQFLEEHILILSKVAGIVIILFGLHTIGILPIKWLYYEQRFHTSKVPSGVAGSFTMGLAFAFGWTPCIGPILTAILVLAGREETVLRGMGLLFVYSLGLGIPFVLTSLGISTFLSFFNRYKKFIRLGEIVAGILLVLIGSLMFKNQLTRLVGLIPDFFLKFSL